jgi:L-threonylcarbamoyladenylate synthase
MSVVRVDPARPDPATIARAAELLRAGRLVAFPTETVYGLGANALDPAAVARIFAAKGRPAYNPLIVHLPNAERARALASDWPAAADRLAAAFWPGPLTLVVPKSAGVPDAVTAGRPNVALRVPSHLVAHALLLAARVPVAAPSANRSTEISPSTAGHVAKSLGDRVDLILDGGPTPVGIESTVVSLLNAVPVLLRPGMVSVDELRDVLGGEIDLPKVTPEADEARLSPGMMERHYAPRAPLVTLDFDGLSEAARRDADAGRRVGVVAIRGDVPGAVSVRLPDDPAEYASRLYSTLHELEDRGVEVIYVEAVPESAAWAGVRDRLRRAATPDAS